MSEPDGLATAILLYRPSMKVNTSRGVAQAAVLEAEADIGETGKLSPEEQLAELDRMFAL